MKTLILVESPTKAKTLTRFLEGKYDISASYGHIRDLPKSRIGIDIKNNFEPQYEIPKDKENIINDLKKRVVHADSVILATDPDREGEAISFHLHEILKNSVKKGTTFQRIVFHEITKSAIEDALKHPGHIDHNLVHAQTARRVLDRIVGYKLSPILWKKVKRGLSAGRVQSVALRIIVEREREIKKFETGTYSKVFAYLFKKGTPNPMQFELTAIDGKSIETQRKIELYDGDYTVTKTILDHTKAEEIKKDIEIVKSFVVKNVIKKEMRRSPLPPYSTSTLQQDASRRLKFSSKKTMTLAQRLYEEGFITYHRTDSFNLSEQFLKESRTYIEKAYGKEYLSDAPRIYKTKSKVAQEAHEAIRPTKLSVHEKNVQDDLGREYARLYSLIYKRAVATQMSDAVFSSTRIEVETQASKIYLFIANGRIMLFPGFLKVWFYEENEQILPEIEIGEGLHHHSTEITDHETTSPPRYNEASLIAALERHGIGRPSTYAPTISTLTNRFYAEKQEGRFYPTEIGIAVTDFLVKNFSHIDDIPFTSQMEESLDDVANGEKDWVTILKEFYKPFEKSLIEAEESERVSVATEATDEKCPKCDSPVVIRYGKFGKFKACSTFPNCDYKASIVLDAGVTCPQDGGKVIIKRTRKGKPFYGCSNYPKCTFAVWNKKELLKATGQPTQSSPAQ